MNYVETLERKSELIKQQFANLIGAKIKGYELAQLWCSTEGEWSDWMDIPLFLIIGNETLSISWRKFDELAIQQDRILPFSVGGNTIRWLCEGVPALDSALEKVVTHVSLGRGEMSIGSQELSIWTRLIIGLEGGEALEIFNALDENGIEFHKAQILEARGQVLRFAF